MHLYIFVLAVVTQTDRINKDNNIYGLSDMIEVDDAYIETCTDHTEKGQ